MMPKRLYPCSLLLLLLSAAATAQPLSVEDFAGRFVTLATPAQRIVALAPHSVENLYSAGAGDKLVGAVSFSNFPEAARSTASSNAGQCASKTSWSSGCASIGGRSRAR